MRLFNCLSCKETFLKSSYNETGNRIFEEKNVTSEHI